MQKPRLGRILATALWLAATTTATTAAAAGAITDTADGGFLEARDVFRIEAVSAGTGGSRLRAVIAPGYYVYRHRVRLQAADGGPVPLDLPAGEAKTDEFFGASQIYRDAVEITARHAAPGQATLHWQGCADAGICYPPQTITVALPTPTATAVTAVKAPAHPATAPAAAPSVAATPSAVAVATASDSDSDGNGDGLAPTPGTDATAATAPVAAQTGAPVAGVAVADGATAPALATDQSLARRLADSGPVTAVLVFFGLGLLLAFTPCTLPMVPIVSGMIVGGRPHPLRALLLSLAYVVSMAAVYAALGVAAGLGGANVQAALQHPLVLGGFAALLGVLALSMFGLFPLQLPAFVRLRLGTAADGRTGGTVAGAAAMGLLSALLVGPCMTAPLAGALLYIGQSGDAAMGGLALFALGLGMGLPLLLIAVFGARILPAPGAWMVRVQAAFGFVMLAVAVWMLERVVAPATALALWGAWSMAVAGGLLALAGHWRDRAASAPAWAARVAAAVVAVWAVALLVGGASGGRDLQQPLAALAAPVAAANAVDRTRTDPGSTDPTRPDPVRPLAVKSAAELRQKLADAGQAGRWTLVDVYADWCVSCQVIEHEVFGDPRVARALASWLVLRPDVTANDAVDQALLREWRIAGPPTLLLIGPDGRERRDLRVVGEIDAEAFLARLGQAVPGARR